MVVVDDESMTMAQWWVPVPLWTRGVGRRVVVVQRITVGVFVLFRRMLVFQFRRIVGGPYAESQERGRN